MTDADINLVIAEIEYPDAVTFESEDGTVYVKNHKGIFKRYNYCNNWEDIGPIIEREKITVDFWDYKQWIAHNNGYTPFVKTRAETPMKAAAMCYLKMRGGVE